MYILIPVSIKTLMLIICIFMFQRVSSSAWIKLRPWSLVPRCPWRTSRTPTTPSSSPTISSKGFPSERCTTALGRRCITESLASADLRTTLGRWAVLDMDLVSTHFIFIQWLQAHEAAVLYLKLDWNQNYSDWKGKKTIIIIKMLNSMSFKANAAIMDFRLTQWIPLTDDIIYTFQSKSTF